MMRPGVQPHHIRRHRRLEHAGHGAFRKLPGALIESRHVIPYAEGFYRSAVYQSPGGKTLVADPESHRPEPRVAGVHADQRIDADYGTRGVVIDVAVPALNNALPMAPTDQGFLPDYPVPDAVADEGEAGLADQFRTMGDNYRWSTIVGDNMAVNYGVVRYRKIPEHE